MADTWSGNSGNQLCTGNAVRNGALSYDVNGITGSNGWVNDVTIPSGLNKKILNVNEIEAYTNIPAYTFFGMSGTDCPTKDEINSAYISSL